ncbi:hypothetical protein JD844_033957 [Phrynosoma platyrhinos]|uniref:A-kinase anchor protein 2 C-terminal domain-containing protein n=1 Tax=Phrynosoma platyrhinos TaxID=52577 RepID=A0ABQ7T7V6_PHRPL|nr:hypothetical protein JD844_033957 [Phrynosoma platyrhinos]
METKVGNMVFTISPNTGLQNKEQNGQWATMHGKRRSDIKEDLEYLEFRNQDQKADHRGERRDGSSWVTKSINSQSDLWTPPLDRNSKLEVVRSGSLYDIRAYKGDRKPSRLYNEEDDELPYRIPPKGISPEKAKELEDERQEIIRSQVVRKSTTVAERLDARDRSANETAFPGKESTETRRSYSTGFAVCFDSHSPGFVSTPVDPKNVDTEQISFAAARQQFLALEKRDPNILLGVKQEFVLPRPRSASGRGESQTSIMLKETNQVDPLNPKGWGRPNEKIDLPTPQRLISHEVMIAQNSARESLASRGLKKIHPGLKVVIIDEKFSQNNTENSLNSVTSNPGSVEGLEAKKETPIEQEIRLSLEREEDLWKQRGIQRVNSRDELVEIRAKPLLSSSLASSAKGKEKPCVSFSVQREIEQETRREEDLQKEGRLLGMYSKGDLQELAERRKVFEREEAIPTFSPGKLKKSGKPWKGKSIFALGDSPANANDGEEIPFQKVMWNFEAQQPTSAQERIPRDDLFFFSQSLTTSDHLMGSPQPKSSSILDSEDPGEELVMQKKHFAIPVRKLNFSFSDDWKPLSIQGEEPRPKRAVPRHELYTLKTWRPRTSALIDQEIQDALQREMELQEERRTTRLTAKMDPSSPLPSQNSAATGVTSRSFMSSPPILTPSSPGRLSALSSPDRVLSERFSSSESDLRTCLSPSMRRREEGKYAGIELSDEIDTEVVKSTKAICRRGVLAQMWETGQICRTHDNDSIDNRN